MKRLGAYLYGELPPPEHIPQAKRFDLFSSSKVIGFEEAVDLAARRQYRDHKREQRFRELCEGRGLP